MKTMILLVIVLSFTNVFAQTAPNFQEIFKQIETTQTVTDAVMLRENYLSKMRNLKDFNQLTDLEKLNTGEEFFEHYRKEMSGFIIENVSKFIKADSVVDKKLFIEKLFPKAQGQKDRFSLAVLGLSYVKDCQDFISYSVQTEKSIRQKYFKNFCSKNNGGVYTELINILIHPRTLDAGRWDAVNFNDFYYVKRIFISAEGLGQDAYFDVMVNGEVKGTIYVPGRDPSYIVTIEDYADQILLRSLSGYARIETILLEIE